MHDTLKYMSKDLSSNTITPVDLSGSCMPFRKTLSSPLDDEVVHGKGSSWERCRGTTGKVCQPAAPVWDTCTPSLKEADFYGGGVCNGGSGITRELDLAPAPV